ncbi:hypothetical protein ACFOEQ_24040 [Chryseobacterium arachidis]|uniref:hypothetical protein n=1 Tax=Chryseobacterium arachidis TaxID=1416778 RepID=UPI00360DF815
MTEQGKLEHTLAGRDNPDGLIVGQGVVQILTDLILLIQKVLQYLLITQITGEERMLKRILSILPSSSLEMQE